VSSPSPHAAKPAIWHLEADFLDVSLSTADNLIPPILSWYRRRSGAFETFQSLSLDLLILRHRRKGKRKVDWREAALVRKDYATTIFMGP
jgi:hypothetical protein